MKDRERSFDEELADPTRLAALERTGLLDTPPEEPFDRLTRLAAKLLRVPVTFISLLDRDRDFYKSRRPSSSKTRPSTRSIAPCPPSTRLAYAPMPAFP